MDETTVTLKCVSESFGTLCLNDSLTTSRCEGVNVLVNLDMIEASIGATVVDMVREIDGRFGLIK